MDGKVATPGLVVAEIAERQHGVISVDQLRQSGISEDAIRGRVLSGHLHRVHRGVYAVGHSALPPEGRWLAAVLAVGGGSRGEGTVLDYWGAAVGHRSAAYLWGLLPATAGPADIMVAGNGGRARRPGIHLHRSRSLVSADLTLRRGIPVTNPSRTIADLRKATMAGAAGALSGRELRKAIRQANVLGLPIDEESDRDRTRSDLELDFLGICRRHRIPPPEINVRIGSCLVDFLWRDRRFVVETDSYIYHRGKVAFQDDRGRDLELKLLGYEVLRLSEQQIDEEPDRVGEVLAATLGGPWRG
ncbi:MAG TPA: type IV toxin-antitoxin system AbiEi family antitoxin domain-containing protein [Solirubrobacterales bacterium]|nr:type IV toxin-antitoxin system AbiEi family antitoxin domain-containing protein [Solirubrobacterales bacterium]